VDNRIVGHADVPPEELAANPRNWREHPTIQRDAMRGVLDTVGWVQDVIVNKTTGRIVDGHLRVELARQNGEATVPVVYVELTDEEERLVLATLDPLAGMATPNRTLVAEILAGLTSSSDSVRDLLAQISNQYGERDTAPPEADALPTDVPTRVQPGELWQLGKHRLVCGDATDEAVAQLVLGGEIPPVMITDPPYGVDYDPNWRNGVAMAKSHASARRLGKTANDDQVDWSAAFQHFPGATAYVWHSALHVVDSAAAIERAGFVIRSQIIWTKPNHSFGRGHYHWQHEPCWYAVRKGSPANWIGGRKQTTNWEIPHVHPHSGGSLDDGQTIHSAQKPVEAMERPMRNHRGAIYDPFLGSGTTLIAGERADRAVYAIELDPTYCDVAVARWEAFTGETAERLAAAAPQEVDSPPVGDADLDS
jgi:DNA modification methylase